MAVLRAWGWGDGGKDFYVDNGWTIHANHEFVTDAAKRHLDDEGNGAANALQIDTNDITTTPAVPTTARWFHAYVVPRVPASPTAWLLHFLIAGGGSFWVRFNSSGTIDLYRGTLLFMADLLATSAESINTGVGHWIAVYANLANSGGEARVYVDGELLVSFTGDTQGAASPGWDQVGLAHNGVGSAGYVPSYCISDIIITDDGPDFPLAERFSGVVPVSGVDSGTLTGNPTTGANRWQNVDDRPSSTSDYNEGTTAGASDTYTTTGLALGSGVAVDFVVLWARAERGGALTQVELGVDSGDGMSYASPDTLPASGWESVGVVLETDPGTADEWDAAAITAGPKLGVRFQ